MGEEEEEEERDNTPRHYFILFSSSRKEAAKEQKGPFRRRMRIFLPFPFFFLKFMNASPLSLVRMREIDISIHFFFSLKLPTVACRTPVLGKKDKKTCLVKKEPMTLLAKNPTQRGESRFAKSSFEF